MTLLERRLEQRRRLLETLYTEIETLKRCDAGGFHDLNTRILVVAATAADLARVAIRVEDLEDVHKYGPTGGL